MSTDSTEFMRHEWPSMPYLILSLISAIEKTGKYKAIATYPSVRKGPRAELEREACEGHRCRYVKAAYVPNSGLYLDSTLDPEHNLVDRSILLHELVHHFQYMTRRYAHLSPCNRQRAEEQEAYEMQNAYLAQVGAGKLFAFPERMYRCEAEDA